MKITSRFLLFVLVAATSAVHAFPEDWSVVIHPAEVVFADEDGVTEIVEEEVVETTTTKRPTTTTTTAAPVTVVAEVEETTTTTTSKATRATTRKPSGSRVRPSSSSRRGNSKPSAKNTNVDREAPPTTSPASVDTASVSINAPKSFRTTAKPSKDAEVPKDLMEYLKRRKMERIQATTTVDPFIAILATATPSVTDQPASVTTERSGSSNRFSAGSSKRLPSGGSARRVSSSRSTSLPSTTSTTTTSAPVVIETRRSSPSRFGSSRGKTTTTTTAEPIIDEPAVVEVVAAKEKFVPKRPTAFRPVGNSISRRKEQAVSTASPVVVNEEIHSGNANGDEEVEPTTRRSFRRASGRLLSVRSSGV